MVKKGLKKFVGINFTNKMYFSFRWFNHTNIKLSVLGYVEEYQSHQVSNLDFVSHFFSTTIVEIENQILDLKTK